MINQSKLDLYLKNGLNVLLEGAHGVGKTEVIKSVFNNNKLKWKYFSASTMDPWVDFIGVPKTVKDENGMEILDLVKPKEFAYDEIEAIFIDEFNRAPSKVTNAIMELIQFKSINGRKFNNLKVVWAAINPYDEENTYKVEEMDPAIVDRFHIKIAVPYSLDAGYLYKKYGKEVEPFVTWWNELPKDLQTKVSPRRLEYAIQIEKVDGDLRDVLYEKTNIKKLTTLLNESRKLIKFENLIKKPDEELKKFFTFENTTKYLQNIIDSKNHNLIQHINLEFIEQKIQQQKNDSVKRFFIQEVQKNHNVFDNLSDSSKQIINKIEQLDFQKGRFGITQAANSTSSSYKRYIISLHNVYHNFYIPDMKKNKCVNINTFFRELFGSVEPEVSENILEKLAITFTTPSASFPPLQDMTFIGLFYNFAIKEAMDKNSVHKTQLENTIKDIYEYSKKTGKLSEFLFGFSEDNWQFIQNSIVKGNVLHNTPDFKNFNDKIRYKKDPNLFNPYPASDYNTSLQKAEEYAYDAYKTRKIK